MTTRIAAFLAGLLFGIGLILSSMTDPARILAFLDVTGSWNPSLAFVMGGAVMASLPAFFYARRRETTPTGHAFSLPERFPITLRLVAGAVIFGLGWGMSGWCPGPSLVSAAAGSLPALVFIATMAISWALARKIAESSGDYGMKWPPLTSSDAPVTTRE